MSMAAETRRIGPRIVMVPTHACDGCPALILERHNGSQQEHANAYCNARRSSVSLLGYLISGYWYPGRPAPGWCPARPQP